MAYTPQAKTLKEDATSASVVNAVLNASPELDSVPRVSAGSITQQTEALHQIGDILSKNSNMYNAFVTTLFNRIIQVVIQTIYFTNPLKRFKRGFLEAGDVVEEIAFRLCTPHQYNSTDDTAYPKQELPRVETAIHKINYQKYYKTTVNRKELLRAFVTYSGMQEFVNEQISILYTSAEMDEYVAMKYMIGRATLNGYIPAVNVTGGTSEAALRQLSIQIRAMGNNMNLLKTKYNYSHMPTRTRKDMQIILINTDVQASMDVEVLANAFNMTRAEFTAQQVLIDGFGYDDVVRMNELFGEESGYVPFTAAELELLNSIQAWQIDERFFMIFDAEFEMTSFFNPEKLYYNFWLHTWKIMSFSTFVNAVAYTPNTTELTGITLAAEPETAGKGQQVVITADFGYGNNIPEIVPSVQWTLTTSTTQSSILPVSENTAYLQVGAAETNTSLTVTASAVKGDGTAVTGTVTVKVAGNTSGTGGYTPPSAA